VRDLSIPMVTAFLLATDVGFLGVLLGICMAEVRFSARQISYPVRAGLDGAATASLLAAVFGDRHGRRRMLVASATSLSIAARL
jgi:MFS family permease